MVEPEREPLSAAGPPMAVVIGYGGTGASTAAALRSDRVVVVERRGDRAAMASAAGLSVVTGEATDARLLLRAGVPDAGLVVITCMHDATSAVVALRVRSLNSSAKVAVAVREGAHAAALRQTGADLVVVATQGGGGLVALTVTGIDTAHAVRVLLADKTRERRPRPHEVGVPVRQCRPVVLSVLRDGVRHWCTDPAVGVVRAGDVLIGWAE